MIPSSIENSITILRSRKEIAEKDYFINRTVFQNIASSAVGWVGSLFFSSDSYDVSKELLFIPLLKSMIDLFLQFIIEECEINHDQLLVVYACRHSDINTTALSFYQ